MYARPSQKKRRKLQLKNIDPKFECIISNVIVLISFYMILCVYNRVFQEM